MSKISLSKKIYRKLLRITPTKLALYIIYFRGYKRILNLKNPKTWGEKIQWLKLYGELEELSNYVDKYEVRKFVRDTIGEEYLNELYNVYDDIEEIDFDALPDKFVLKCTNGSGTVIVCNDKNTFDINKAKKKMKKWLKDDYSKEKKEFQYKNIRNRIIIEKYLENRNRSLTDYKFYCFDGKVKYYAIFYDRNLKMSVDVYSTARGKLEGVKDGNIPNSNYTINNIEKKNISKMIALSEKLSEKFSSVRVDFYCVKNKPIFGELTFTDGAGSENWNPMKFDLEIASYLKLEKIYKDNGRKK